MYLTHMSTLRTVAASLIGVYTDLSNPADGQTYVGSNICPGGGQDWMDHESQTIKMPKTGGGRLMRGRTSYVRSYGTTRKEMEVGG